MTTTTKTTTTPPTMTLITTEEYNKYRLEKATEYYETGWSLINNHLDEISSVVDLWKTSYNTAIDQFQNCLHIRESILGRYHKDTASVYIAIGYSYSQKLKRSFYSTTSKQDKVLDKAIAAYHTGVRIRRYLDYESNNNDKDPPSPLRLGSIYKSLLQTKGLTNKQIQYYQTNLDLSIEYEMKGDIQRRNIKERGTLYGGTCTYRGGYYFDASIIDDYQTAIQLENQLFPSSSTLGSANPVTALLHRKIALIVGLRRKMEKGTTTTLQGEDHNTTDCVAAIDWENADRISVSIDGMAWLNDLNNGLYQTACETIRRGDELYTSFQYEEAMKEYQQTSISMEQLLLHSSSGSGSSGSGGIKHDDATRNQYDDMDHIIQQNQKIIEQTISESIDGIRHDIMSSMEELLTTKLSNLDITTKVGGGRGQEEETRLLVDSDDNFTRTVVQSILKPIVSSQIDTMTQIKTLHIRTERLAETMDTQNMIVLGLVVLVIGISLLKRVVFGSGGKGLTSSNTNKCNNNSTFRAFAARRNLRRRRRQMERHVTWKPHLVEPFCDDTRNNTTPAKKATKQHKKVTIQLRRINQLMGWEAIDYTGPTTSDEWKSSQFETSTSQHSNADLLIESCRRSSRNALKRISDLIESDNIEQAKVELCNFREVEDAFFGQLRDAMMVLTNNTTQERNDRDTTSIISDTNPNSTTSASDEEAMMVLTSNAALQHNDREPSIIINSNSNPATASDEDEDFEMVPQSDSAAITDPASDESDYEIEA